MGFEAQLHILKDRQPWKKRESLENHGDAIGGSYDRVAVDDDFAFAWGQKARDDAEKRGFAGTGTAEQRDNLVVVQGQINMIEHKQIAGHAALEEVADILDGNQGLPFGGPRYGYTRRYTHTHVFLPVHWIRRRRSAST